MAPETLLSPHSCPSMESLSGVVQVSLRRISISDTRTLRAHAGGSLTLLAECRVEASPKSDSIEFITIKPLAAMGSGAPVSLMSVLVR
jgi:hypothetical protein